MYKKKLTFISFAVLLSLTLSMVFPTGVLADDGNPPPSPETVEVVTQPEETPTTEEGAASDAVIPESPNTETEMQDASEDTVSATNIVSLLSQLPEGTDVVVLNENGDPVPLASQDAAEILILPDPQFCPTGFLPGSPQCGTVQTTIQAAVNDAKTAGVAGTVYIQSGTFNENVTIADFSAALTLQGVFSLNPYTVLASLANRPIINGRIFIQDGADSGNVGNTANITLADLIINNNDTTTGDDPTIVADRNTANLTFINLDINAPSNADSGLVVTNHSGNVILTNVDGSGTASRGVDINNTSGTGNVSVTGGTFNQNIDDGLRIVSKGLITLLDVIANSNGGQGADIDNTSGTGNVSLTGGTFNLNNDDGLDIRSHAAVTLTGVTAVQNISSSDGVFIDNTSGTGNVSVTGSTISQNVNDGLFIRSDGLITLDQLTANQNGLEGADISNATGGSVAGANIFVVKSTFDLNGDDGLNAASNLDITLINVTATNNVNDGADLTSVGDNLVICGGVFGGNNTGAGAVDYDVRGTGATRTRTSDITITSWLTSASWTTLTNGTAPCNYQDPDSDQLPNQWDTDDDNDSVLDGNDTCPTGASTGIDTDGDGCKNTEDTDDDNDGVLDVSDAFPLDPTESVDTDGDGSGNNADNCPSISNSAQTDTDGDGTGDACDSTSNGDNDSDGIDNLADNCPSIANSAQTDTDNDGIGDTCDVTPNGDSDEDGVGNLTDNCPSTPNSEQTDSDGDGTGDACDATPNGNSISNGAVGTNGKFSNEASLLIPVTGGQATDLSCTEPATTLTVAGFQVTFINLCKYSVVVTAAPNGSMPDGNKFVGGINIVLLQNGVPVKTLPADAEITLSFEIPSSVTGETLAVLYWNAGANGGAGAWMEKTAAVDNGKLILTIDVLGTFVLAD